MSSTLRLLAALAVVFLLAGCSGSSSSPPPTGVGSPSGSGTVTPPPSGGGTVTPPPASSTTPPPSSGSTLPAATLTWTASTSSTVTGYRIYYGTTSGTYTNHIDVGNITQYAIQTLPAGTYYFAVTAYDASGGESADSNEVSKAVP